MPLASTAGVLGWDCDAGEGSMYTESVGGRGKLCSLCSSTASSVSKGEIASFFSHGQTAAPMSEDSKFSTRPSCSCCGHYSFTMVSLRHSPSGFSSSG